MTTTATAVNQTQSLAAIRNFVRAAVSFITYARGLCNENAYELRPFLGLPLRQLIPSTAESVTISEWIEKGAFDALNRNYLKEMSLCIYDAECKELLESYCFGFNYSAGGQRAQMSLAATQQPVESSQISKTKGGQRDSQVTQIASTAAGPPSYRKRRCTKQEVQLMLTHILERLLDVVSTLPPLLAKRVLALRLTYYDEVTPSDYEAPCFAPASRKIVQLYQDEVKLHVHIGSMDTSHHFFSVAIRHPLLQQVQHQIAEEKRVSAEAKAMIAAEGGKPERETGNSAQLRSGLESTFSSASTDANTFTADPHRTTPSNVLTGVTQQNRTTRDAVAELTSDGDDDNDGINWDGAALRHSQGGDAGAETEGADTNQLTTVMRLVEECAATAARPRTLKERELAYLLLAAFVFSHAPSAPGGRGRLAIRDVDVYRAESCPLDIAANVAQQMLRQLVQEGHLHAVQERPRAIRTPAAFPATPKNNNASGVEEWTVADPPLPLLQKLLQVERLTQLLAHPCHIALQELCVFLERERARKSACASPEVSNIDRNRMSRKRTRS